MASPAKLPHQASCGPLLNGRFALTLTEPRWSYLPPHWHPAVLDIPLFAVVKQITTEHTGALLGERYSLRPRAHYVLTVSEVTSATRVEGSRRMVARSLHGDGDGYWVKAESTVVSLGGSASFAATRAAHKAAKPAPLTVAAPTGPVGNLVTAIDGTRTQFVPFEAVLRAHPYLTGSWDHFNSQMVKDVSLQFCTLVLEARHGAGVPWFPAAGSSAFLAFIELGLPVEVILDAQERAVASADPFATCEPGALCAEWAGVASAFRVQCSLWQNGKRCAQVTYTLVDPRAVAKM